MCVCVCVCVCVCACVLDITADSGAQLGPESQRHGGIIILVTITYSNVQDLHNPSCVFVDFFFLSFFLFPTCYILQRWKHTNQTIHSNRCKGSHIVPPLPPLFSLPLPQVIPTMCRGCPKTNTRFSKHNRAFFNTLSLFLTSLSSHTRMH